jgi:hypothetical protein
MSLNSILFKSKLILPLSFKMVDQVSRMMNCRVHSRLLQLPNTTHLVSTLPPLNPTLFSLLKMRSIVPLTKETEEKDISQHELDHFSLNASAALSFLEPRYRRSLSSNPPPSSHTSQSRADSSKSPSSSPDPLDPELLFSTPVALPATNSKNPRSESGSKSSTKQFGGFKAVWEGKRKAPSHLEGSTHKRRRTEDRLSLQIAKGKGKAREFPQYGTRNSASSPEGSEASPIQSTPDSPFPPVSIHKVRIYPFIEAN